MTTRQSAVSPRPQARARVGVRERERDHAEQLVTPRRARTRTSLNEKLARPTPAVWLSGQEAAEHVGVSWPTLRQLIIEHAIPHIRLGTRWKIDATVLDDHLRHLAEGQVGRS